MSIPMELLRTEVQNEKFLSGKTVRFTTAEQIRRRIAMSGKSE